MKFKIATSNKDDQNDVINIDGIEFKDRTLVTKEFDAHNAVGYATITKEDNVLFAEIDLPEESKGLYPAIGFQVKRFVISGGVRVLEEIKLQYAGLCVSPNVDKSIPPI